MHSVTTESIESGTQLDASVRPIELLFIDDDLEDVRRTRDALAESKINNTVHVVTDAGSAREFFGEPGDLGDEARPDAVLLSLRLWEGRDRSGLEELVSECLSQKIPVFAVTDGEPDRMVVGGRAIAVDHSLSRPVDFVQLVRLVRSVEAFWFTIVRVGPVGG
jgi:two-component system, chemotaxis family, response regulator Rcp1